MPKRKEPEWAPWLPIPYEIPDVGAVQALARGDATPEQQRRALLWIMENAAGVYLETFHPDNARWTDFACGRRFVGTQIGKMLRLNIARLTEIEARKRGKTPEPSEQQP